MDFGDILRLLGRFVQGSQRDTIGAFSFCRDARAVVFGRVATVPVTEFNHVEGAPGPLYLYISSILSETAVVGELRNQLPRGRAAPVVPLVE